MNGLMNLMDDDGNLISVKSKLEKNSNESVEVEIPTKRRESLGESELIDQIPEKRIRA